MRRWKNEGGEEEFTKDTPPKPLLSFFVSSYVYFLTLALKTLPKDPVKQAIQNLNGYSKNLKMAICLFYSVFSEGFKK